MNGPELSLYDLSSPERKIKLPHSLEEISGLSLYKDNSLACINDEEGKLFLVSIATGEVTRTIKFAKSGDYEGVEVVNDRFYVIESNGDFREFIIKDNDEAEEKEHKLPFSSKNDIEGLGYDPRLNNLLIVTKNSSDVEDNDIDGKAVYSFDLKKKEFVKKPLLIITENELKEKLGDKDFNASGIAYNPADKCYYLIASAGKKMIKIDTLGNILECEYIDSKILRQPEGITFDASGNMYISSEGRGGKGYILYYRKK